MTFMFENLQGYQKAVNIANRMGKPTINEAALECEA